MPQQGNTYVVQGGDNLFSIAEQVYGDQKMFVDIMRLNKLGSGVIRPGMVLTLPKQRSGSALSASMDKNLISNLSAENKLVHETGKIPSRQELSQYMSGVQPQTSISQSQLQMRGRSAGVNREMSAEQQQMRGRSAGVAPRSSTPYDPSAGWTNESKKAYGERYGTTQEKNRTLDASKFKELTNWDGLNTTQKVGVGLLAAPVAAVLSSYKKQDAPYDAAYEYKPTVYPMYRDSAMNVQKQPSSYPLYKQQTAATQAPPVAPPVAPTQLPAITDATSYQSLATLPLAPEQKDAYSDLDEARTIFFQNLQTGGSTQFTLTQEMAESFTNNFQVQDPDFYGLLDAMLNSPNNTAYFVPPVTNEEFVGSIYDMVMNTGYYGMPNPMDAINQNRSGSGGSTGENTGGNSSFGNIGGGGNVTKRGY